MRSRTRIGSGPTLLDLVAPNQRRPIDKHSTAHEPVGACDGQFVAYCSSIRYGSVISHSSNRSRRPASVRPSRSAPVNRCAGNDGKAPSTSRRSSRPRRVSPPPAGVHMAASPALGFCKRVFGGDLPPLDVRSVRDDTIPLIRTAKFYHTSVTKGCKIIDALTAPPRDEGKWACLQDHFSALWPCCPSD
jgi:hypothetical protein